MLYTHTRPDRGRRQETFKRMVDHVLERRGVIVETGTSANPNDHIGAGNSTEIWNDLAINHRITAVSIDIDPSCIRIAQVLAPNVQFLCGDAAEVLRHMPGAERICLLYLDSMWDPLGGQALRELQAIWPRLFRGCMIAIDDRHSDEVGKHVAVEAWLRKLGLEPVFKDYQIGWIK